MHRASTQKYLLVLLLSSFFFNHLPLGIEIWVAPDQRGDFDCYALREMNVA